MATHKRDILWEIGCEGHTDAWVVAESWELATVEAARFWGVPWRTMAARCEEKKRVEGAPRNICCRCGKTYFGPPPMCGICAQASRQEEERMRHLLRRAYQQGKVV